MNVPASTRKRLNFEIDAGNLRRVLSESEAVHWHSSVNRTWPPGSVRHLRQSARHRCPRRTALKFEEHVDRARFAGASAQDPSAATQNRLPLGSAPAGPVPPGNRPHPGCPRGLGLPVSWWIVAGLTTGLIGLHRAKLDRLFRSETSVPRFDTPHPALAALRPAIQGCRPQDLRELPQLHGLALIRMIVGSGIDLVEVARIHNPLSASASGF